MSHAKAWYARHALLLGMCLWVGVLGVRIADAAPTTEALLRPTEVQNVQMSPSGLRIAFLRKGKKSGSDFTVVELRPEGLVPVFVTQLPANQSFSSYQWLSDDYLSLSFSSSDQTLNQLSIASIRDNKVTVLEPAANVIKPRWGDDDHVLISSSSGCSVSEAVRGRCLIAYNLRTGGRTTVASAVQLLPIVFIVMSESEVYARGTDEKREQHAMQFDAASRSWSEIPLAKLRQANEAQQARELALNPGSRDMPAGSRLVGPKDKPAIGYISPLPARGFTSLSADFDSLEAALETRFAGRHTMLVQVNDDLDAGLVISTSIDRPMKFYLWSRKAGLIALDAFSSSIDEKALAVARIDKDWQAGTSIVVTEPPAFTAVSAIVIEPVFVLERYAAAVADVFNGEAQAFALRGVMHVLVPVVLPAQFANGAAAVAWRQSVHDSLQQLVTTAPQRLNHAVPVCLVASGYSASMLLSGPGLDGLTCMSGANAALLPARLSERIDLEGGAYMRLPNATLERQVRGAFALSDGSMLDPVDNVKRLPARVLLSYQMTDPLYQVFSRQSGAFRSAASKAGKQVQFLASMSDRDNEDAYSARIVDATIEFVRAAPRGGVANAAAVR